MNYDLKIIPDILWSDEQTHKPTYYATNGHTILIKQEYLNQINKKKVKTYSWIVHEYAIHVFYMRFGKTYFEPDNIFPENKQSKFAFAYEFEYLKKHGLRNLMELNEDKWLMNLYLRYPIIKTYFNNSNFIMSYPER
jgi:hypothetical protein